jgi:hypothetical protein
MAAAVAAQAAAEGHARRPLPADEVRRRTGNDIAAVRNLMEVMTREGLLPLPPQSMIDEALSWAISRIGEDAAGR